MSNREEFDIPEFLRKPAISDIRSNLAQVRNPLLRLEAAQKLANLPPEAKEALNELLLELRKDCQVNADKCWKKHKAPMAAYWKAASVYIGHTSRLLRINP